VAFGQADLLDRDRGATRDAAVIGIVVQFLAPALRAGVFARIARAVSPAGRVLPYGHAPRQVSYGAWGPKAAENRCTPELLRGGYLGWWVLAPRDCAAELAEGSSHAGRAALIDFVARKPKA
jgi:hypothetical protein